MRRELSDLKAVREEMRALPSYQLPTDLAQHVAQACSKSESRSLPSRLEGNSSRRLISRRTVFGIVGIAVSILIAIFALRPDNSLLLVQNQQREAYTSEANTFHHDVGGEEQLG